MSVYIHKKTADGVYSYDFQISGRRFYGSTGKTTKREAETEEKRLKEEARDAIKAERALAASCGASMTFFEAAARFWTEVGQHRPESNAADTLRHLEWLKDHFGDTTLLADITNNRVAQMVAKRRGEFIPNRKDKVLVSPSTVNRTATIPLREIMLRARDVWEVDVPRITWTKHLLDEPKERVREASTGEELAFLGKLERGYDVAVRFAIRMACRRMEILNLDWPHVDLENKRLTLKGKRGNDRILPLPPDMEQLLKHECWRHHKTKVFTYVAKKTRVMADGRQIERGKRYPLTKEGLKVAFRRAVATSGVENFRFHDLRHTGATRTLRAAKNLRAVQALLGHEDIATTTKYAHVAFDDVADALAALNPGEFRMAQKIPEKVPENTDFSSQHIENKI